MKKKIVGALVSLLLLVAIGGSVATWYVASISADLNHLVELHEVQDLRHDLVIDTQAVQTDLYTAQTVNARDTYIIFENLEKLKVVSDQCLSCHHDPDNEDKLVEINRLVEEYEVALRNYLTAQEDEEATAALRIFATALLEKIKLESETMSLEASVRLDKISNTAMTRIQRTWLILPFALALLLCLGIVISAHLVRSVTDPIEKLVEATEIISSGGIGHQIEYSGEVEFEKLTRNFNTMSSSLKGNIDRLHSANEDL